MKVSEQEKALKLRGERKAIDARRVEFERRLAQNADKEIPVFDEDGNAVKLADLKKEFESDQRYLDAIQTCSVG